MTTESVEAVTQTPSQELSRSAEPPAPRVLVLAFNYKPSNRVIEYVLYLASQGVHVDLIVVDQRRKEWLELDPRIPASGIAVHTLLRSEHHQPLRRAEWLLLHRIPLGVLAQAQRLLSKSRLTRPLARPFAVVERGYAWLANGFHRRVFMPCYRHLRPWLLSRPSRKSLRAVDLGATERIVAADISAVTLGWRLARRFKDTTATTDLDRVPYAARTSAATGLKR